jgi:hypothetical protein
MALNLEQIKQSIEQLPPIEIENLREWLNNGKSDESEGKEAKCAELERGEDKFRRALKWIDEHREEYDGQFILLEGDELIAHGTDAKALYAEARARGIETPLVHRVKAKILPFGGW